jgi:hypothetical protein
VARLAAAKAAVELGTAPKGGKAKVKSAKAGKAKAKSGKAKKGKGGKRK